MSVREPVEKMSALTQRIVADLRAHGPSTAQEIGARIGESARSVRLGCTYARSFRWLDDGVPAEAIKDSRGRIVGAAHGESVYPIRWRVIEDGDPILDLYREFDAATA